MNRRPATAEDMTIGATVYKGSGNVAFRVADHVASLYDGKGGWNVVKTTTKAAKGRFYEPLRVFTVDA